MTEIEKLQIYRKSKEGKGYKKIAAELNIPVSSVTAYLQRHKEEPILHCECCGKEFKLARLHRKIATYRCTIYVHIKKKQSKPFVKSGVRGINTRCWCSLLALAKQ